MPRMNELPVTVKPRPLVMWMLLVCSNSPAPRAPKLRTSAAGDSSGNDRWTATPRVFGGRAMSCSIRSAASSAEGLGATRGCNGLSAQGPASSQSEPMSVSKITAGISGSAPGIYDQGDRPSSSRDAGRLPAPRKGRKPSHSKVNAAWPVFHLALVPFSVRHFRERGFQHCPFHTLSAKNPPNRRRLLSCWPGPA